MGRKSEGLERIPKRQLLEKEEVEQPGGCVVRLRNKVKIRNKIIFISVNHKCKTHYGRGGCLTKLQSKMISNKWRKGHQYVLVSAFP